MRGDLIRTFGRAVGAALDNPERARQLRARVETAVRSGRLDPTRLMFAASQDQAGAQALAQDMLNSAANFLEGQP